MFCLCRVFWLDRFETGFSNLLFPLYPHSGTEPNAQDFRTPRGIEPNAQDFRTPRGSEPNAQDFRTAQVRSTLKTHAVSIFHLFVVLLVTIKNSTLFKFGHDSKNPRWAWRIPVRATRPQLFCHCNYLATVVILPL